jgi:hypothetical protein
MLYDAITFGSKVFHALEPLGGFYDDYMREKKYELWDSANSLNASEMSRLILFVNQWRTHYQSAPQQLLKAIQEVHPILQALQGHTILDMDFTSEVHPGMSVEQAIEEVFETILKCGKRREATGTAKILHTINPDLFVMWDKYIAAGYAVNTSGEGYAQHFLPRMQKLLKRAVGKCMQRRHETREEALMTLRPCGHTLAKVVDEYNYSKYTLKTDEIWDLEFE